MESDRPVLDDAGLLLSVGVAMEVSKEMSTQNTDSLNEWDFFYVHQIARQK